MHIATRLPTNIELGAERTDTMELEILRTDGGDEHINRLWSQFLREYQVTYPIAKRESDATLATIYDAFLASGGGEDSFDFRDWRDHTATDQALGLGDGVKTAFPLLRNYTFGSRTHARRIYRPVSPIVVKRNGAVITTGFTIDYQLGIVNFTVAPTGPVVGPPAVAAQAISWSGEFNVPVRFDKRLSSKAQTIHNEKFDDFTLKERRLRAEHFS